MTVLATAAPGCVLPFPHPHTAVPKASFRVIGDVGQPLPGADVVVYLGSRASSSLRERTRTSSNEDGVAEIARDRDVHWFAVMGIPHAEAGERWGYCVAANGYEPARGEIMSVSEARLTIRLQLGSGSCDAELVFEGWRFAAPV